MSPYYKGRKWVLIPVSTIDWVHSPFWTSISPYNDIPYDNTNKC